jgi:DNA-binding IclR family transcriptional regulator
MDTGNPDTIPTNLRLLLVLEEVARAGVPVTPTEVNAALKLPKPTIHRLFATLEEEGFLQRDIDGRTYSAGLRLRKLSGGILSSLRIRTARLAILKRLSLTVGETCNIALPDRDAMLYIERVETEWPLRIQLPVGTRVPFYCTASGKMYLSSLPQSHLARYAEALEFHAYTGNSITSPGVLMAEVDTIRRQGFALDREEFMDGMFAIAVPIAGPNGGLLSTLSFHAPSQRLSIDKALSFLPDLQAAAVQLSDLLLNSDIKDAAQSA